MDGFLDKAEWGRSLIINFIAIILVAALLSFFGAFPWATASELEKLNGKYDHVIALKNQDNQWYRELEVKVGIMGNDISHIKDSIAEIKTHVLAKH